MRCRKVCYAFLDIVMNNLLHTAIAREHYAIAQSSAGSSRAQTVSRFTVLESPARQKIMVL
jgi:hypothetical protein